MTATLGQIHQDLTDLLAAAEQVANIDNDGDLSCTFTTGTLPSFTNNFLACAMQYSIRVNAGNETASDANSLHFTASETELSFEPPYCRVGKKQSIDYEVFLKADFFVAKRLEVHEITLSAGKLDIPTLEASSISISRLSALKDNSDGSYGVEFEIAAYPRHFIFFEVLSERPGPDDPIYGRFEEDAVTSATSWLFGVKDGQKIYVCFSEFEPIGKDVAVSFSGTAGPAEGGYSDDSSGEHSSGREHSHQNSPGGSSCFEWHMYRGSVNLGDVEDDDDRAAIERAIQFVEQGNQEAALDALPALWFEYNMDNLDSSPSEFMPGSQEVNLDINYTNPNYDISLDVEDGRLIVTATIRFPMDFNPDVDEDELNDWLSENGGYAAGFLSANWGYHGDEGGHFVFLRGEDADAGGDNYRSEDDASELIQTVKGQLAGTSGVAIFIDDDVDGELIDSLICDLEGDGALLIQIEAGANYMDYIAPLMEAEEGRTAILDGVQHIEEGLIVDFLRIVSDRVLVGSIGEGDDAQLFEMPMSAFNLVLIDRGGGETYLIRNACDVQLATDVFGRGIKPSATTLETSDGGVLSLLSTFFNQCAPDSGWFDGDGQTAFVMPDGTTVLATQSEYEDVGEWIETYDEMTVKHITEYNGIEFSDEEVDEYLQESGGLFHFKFEIEMLGGHAVYEFVQFGEGEIAAESSEVIGIDGGEIFSWTQNAIAEAWQAAP